MTDLALLADNTQTIAEAMEAAYDEGDQGAILGVLRANADAFRDMANGSAEVMEDAALREFYASWTPTRRGRETVGLEPKLGPMDLASLWMRVSTKGRGADLAAVLTIARNIAKMWAAITPQIIEDDLPDEFNIGTIMGPSSRADGGDDEKMVYKTVKRADLTSSQMALLKIKERPLDMTAANDPRLQGLVYALVQAVKATED